MEPTGTTPSGPWQPPSPPGWFPDPDHAAALRFWDGVRWTEHRAAAEHSRPARDELRTLPLASAVVALAATAASLAASKVIVRSLVHHRWPIAVYVLIAAVTAYGPLLVCCRMIVRRWGTGSLRDDLGFRFRRVDLGWGPVTWAACLLGQIVVAAIVLAFDIPIVSNTEGISKLSGDRAYIISFAILAVVAAPFVEELVFRGVVMRGLLSRLPGWASVGLQGVLFGAAHIDPDRGMGNIGLVMVLSAVGVVLGGSALLLRRLAPTMISHAMTNTLAVVLTLTR